MTAVEDVAADAVEDMRRLSRASRRIVGLLDASAIASRTAQELGAVVGTDATATAIREAPDVVVLRGGWRVRTPEVRRGLRIHAGDGVGGRVLRTGRPLAVPDLGAEQYVSEELVEQVVRREGVHAILGVPLHFRGEVNGVLYAVNRSARPIGERVVAVAEELAASAGPALGAALHTERARRLGAAEERQRISRDLHDHIGPLIFGIGAAAQRAKDGLPEGAWELAAQLAGVEALAARAGSELREALRAFAPTRSGEGLAAAIGVDVACFTDRTGIPADLAVTGDPTPLSAAQESALLGAVREGLHNAARHAHPMSVLVTLHHAATSTDVIVQDDGCGMPGPPVLHHGLASLRRRLVDVGGELMLTANEDGGTSLRGSIDHHDVDALTGTPVPAHAG